VDAVIDSLADLDGRPVGEHVAVFEVAHDRLRDALAEAGDDSPAS
jgi:sirohydrochlorin ferrochelatase